MPEVKKRYVIILIRNKKSGKGGNRMYRVLVACRAGVGSSLILKIKMNQVIEENHLPIAIEHTNLDSVPGFDGDAIFTLSDVAEELKAQYPERYIVGVKNIVDKNQLLKEMQEFLKTKE